MKFTSLTLGTLIAGSASSATAAVVSFLDQNIGIPVTYAGVSVDLETGAFENDLDGISDGDMNFLFGGDWVTNDADESIGSPTWQPVRVGTGPASNSDLIRNLGIGSVVGPGSVYASGYGGSTGHIQAGPSPVAPDETFEAGERGFIGFSLELADSTIAYGWVEVTMQDDNTPGVIHGWAYQDDGSSLEVGGIPEPSQSVLVMIGVLATTLRRRRGAVSD